MATASLMGTQVFLRAVFLDDTHIFQTPTVIRK
jgi:hypothetical protein